MDKLREDDDGVIKTPDIGKTSVDIVLDELQKDPVDRQYVNRCVPRLKLDPAWIEPPCYYGDEGHKMDWDTICTHYVYTILENPSLGKADTNVLRYRFDCCHEERKKAYCDNIKNTIKYDPAYEEQANRFLEELYNIYKPSFVEYNGDQYYSGNLFKGVIKHFIWSIKWKMNKGEQCLHNLFINFEGEQGCGKSQFAEHLGKAILGNYYTYGDINLLEDKFGAAILEDKFFINFDEIVKNDVPIEKIKQITTAEMTEYRKMMTEKYIRHYIRASFMSTCNKPIYEVIVDDTGNRRFANFKFMNGCIKDDVELCSKLDKLWSENVVALWKSVDENRPNGYVVGNELGILLDRARTTYNAKGDTVRKWLKSTNKCIVSSFKSGSQRLDVAYDDYKEYCSIDDQTPCSLENFKTRIKNMYTGKVRLAPNKLAIASFIAASTNEEIDQSEVNPFSEYKEFIPYKFNDEKQGIQNIPLIPPKEPNLEQKNKNVISRENQGGISGISRINYNENELDNVQKMIKEQEARRKNWDGTIEYEEPQQSNDTNDEFVQDNDDFFARLARGEI